MMTFCLVALVRARARCRRCGVARGRGVPCRRRPLVAVGLGLGDGALMCTPLARRARVELVGTCDLDAVGARVGRRLVGLVRARASRRRGGVALGRGVPCRGRPLVAGDLGLGGGALMSKGRGGAGGAGGVGGVARGEARSCRSCRIGGRLVGLVRAP